MRDTVCSIEQFEFVTGTMFWQDDFLKYPLRNSNRIFHHYIQYS